MMHAMGMCMVRERSVKSLLDRFPAFRFPLKDPCWLELRKGFHTQLTEDGRLAVVRDGVMMPPLDRDRDRSLGSDVDTDAAGAGAAGVTDLWAGCGRQLRLPLTDVLAALAGGAGRAHTCRLGPWECRITAEDDAHPPAGAAGAAGAKGPKGGAPRVLSTVWEVLSGTFAYHLDVPRDPTAASAAAATAGAGQGQGGSEAVAAATAGGRGVHLAIWGEFLAGPGVGAGAGAGVGVGVGVGGRRLHKEKVRLARQGQGQGQGQSQGQAADEDEDEDEGGEALPPPPPLPGDAATAAGEAVSAPAPAPTPTPTPAHTRWTVLPAPALHGVDARYKANLPLLVAISPSSAAAAPGADAGTEGAGTEEVAGEWVAAAGAVRTLRLQYHYVGPTEVHLPAYGTEE